MQDCLPKGFSIVLCTYNGTKRLGPTLRHLAQLTVPEGTGAELVLVNNASSDHTEAFVQEEWTSLGAPFTLRVILEERAGKGFAIETGYDAARYTYIVTVDDDNWLNADYLVHSLAFLRSDPDIGILQGQSIGVFESDPPSWVKAENIEHYFVIGAPIEQPGYYPEHSFGAWGAGMVLRTEDWAYLRSLGFGFLTSKIAGKAAGEDHELARALLMIGRRIFYSERLQYRHFMPAGRIDWEFLKRNFKTFGYVSHYNFLYALVLDAYEKGYPINKSVVRRRFFQYFSNSVRSFTAKQYLSYWLRPQKQYYQLRLSQHLAHCKWFFKLSKNVMHDIRFLQNWMEPVLKQHQNNFKWPTKLY